ncbi:MAG: C40 family peptidase [Actinobacteria bacterium]|nr:C40 family peptidase [Actinomycetota bacterium]MCA1722079.1 C40 family peptidase [Actinomycetota bacterium]
MTFRRRALVPLLLAASLSAGLAVASAPASAAAPAVTAPVTSPVTSPADDAAAKARALRLEVDRLRVEAEQAAEDYDAAYDQLGRVVSAHLSAQQALDTAVSTADSRSATAGRRVRALYMSGGAPALYATVLQGSDIGDVLSRLQSVRRVVGGDRTASQAATKDVVGRTKAEAELARIAATRTALQEQVAGRADRVRELLAQTDALLAEADERVRVLAEQQRQAAEAAAAQRAAERLAQAQAAWQQTAEAAGAAPGPGAFPVFGAAPAPTEAAGQAIAEALTHVGKPYLWGATGPGAFDCSGLTLTAYRAAGLGLPRTSREQWYAGPHVELGALQPGDLLFWASDLSNPSTIHHVAMYLGNGQMVAAPHAGAQVRVQPVYLDGYLGAVRPAVAVS